MSRQTTHLVEVLASDLTYLPNPEQRKVKEAFWLRFNENPTCEPTHISQSIVEGITGDSRVSRWWSQPGFKEWLRNQEEFRERAATLAHLALDTIHSILINETAQPSARVNAAKLAMEIARKMPQKQTEAKYADEKITEMDKKQLEAYISKNMKILPSKVLTDNPAAGTLEEPGD